MIKLAMVISYGYMQLKGWLNNTYYTRNWKVLILLCYLIYDIIRHT